MTKFRLIALVAASAAVLVPPELAAKSRADIPLAPIPAKVLSAKKLFLLNAAVDTLAYDSVYAAVKDWQRFEIVDSASAADLLMVVTTVTWGRPVRVNGRHVLDEQIILTIQDANSRDTLWSAAERRRFALREKNQDKETIDAAERLVASLKLRMSLPH